jgi:hypothetical protein
MSRGHVEGGDMEIDESNLRIPEWLEEQARQHLVEGDLFTFQNPVIPIRTNGLGYGAWSQKVVDEGVQLPDLDLTQNHARFLHPYLFVALRDDDPCTDLDVSVAALACMHEASAQGIKQIAFPVLEMSGDLSFIAAAERGILMGIVGLQAMEWHVPDHIYVKRLDIETLARG